MASTNLIATAVATVGVVTAVGGYLWTQGGRKKQKLDDRTSNDAPRQSFIRKPSERQLCRQQKRRDRLNNVLASSSSGAPALPDDNIFASGQAAAASIDATMASNEGSTASSDEAGGGSHAGPRHPRRQASNPPASSFDEAQRSNQLISHSNEFSGGSSLKSSSVASLSSVGDGSSKFASSSRPSAQQNSTNRDLPLPAFGEVREGPITTSRPVNASVTTQLSLVAAESSNIGDGTGGAVGNDGGNGEVASNIECGLQTDSGTVENIGGGDEVEAAETRCRLKADEEEGIDGVGEWREGEVRSPLQPHDEVPESNIANRLGDDTMGETRREGHTNDELSIPSDDEEGSGSKVVGGIDGREDSPKDDGEVAQEASSDGNGAMKEADGDESIGEEGSRSASDDVVAATRKSNNDAAADQLREGGEGIVGIPAAKERPAAPTDGDDLADESTPAPSEAESINDVPPPSVAEHAAPESEDDAAAMSGRSESNASPISGDDAAGITEEEEISLDAKADGDEASSSDAKDDEVEKETYVLKEKYTEDQKRRDDAPKCDFEECDGKPASSMWVSKKGLESRLSCDDCQRGNYGGSASPEEAPVPAALSVEVRDESSTDNISARATAVASSGASPSVPPALLPSAVTAVSTPTNTVAVDNSIAEETTTTVLLAHDNLVHNASPPIGHSNPPDQAAAMLVDNVVGEANNNLTNENMAMRGSTCVQAHGLCGCIRNIRNIFALPGDADQVAVAGGGANPLSPGPARSLECPVPPEKNKKGIASYYEAARDDVLHPLAALSLADEMSATEMCSNCGSANHQLSLCGGAACYKEFCPRCLQPASNDDYEILDDNGDVVKVCTGCYGQIPSSGRFKIPEPLQATSVLNHPGVELRSVLPPYYELRGFLCRNGACTKLVQARKDDFCNGCFSQFQVGNISFQPDEEFDHDYDQIVFDPAPEVESYDSLVEKYAFIAFAHTSSDGQKTFRSTFKTGTRQQEMPVSAIPDDMAFMRSIVSFITKGTMDSNFISQHWKTWFAERERSVEFLSAHYREQLDLDPVNHLASLKSFFADTANWLHNIFAPKNKITPAENLDCYRRLFQVLKCLKKPSNIQRLWPSSEFVRQHDGDGIFDVTQRFEALSLTHDSDGYLRREFAVNGADTEVNKRAKYQALLFSLKKGFAGDLRRMTSGDDAPWAGHEEEGKEVIRFLQFLHDELIGTVSQEEMHYFQVRKQETLADIQARREEARNLRASEGERIPDLDEAAKMGLSVDDYLGLDMFNEHFEELHEQSQLTKAQLKATETYQLFVDAQNAFGCIDDLQPLKDALLREFDFTWGMVATFTDAEFAAGSSTEKKRYLGLAMYKICWRLRKGCCIPWCTRDTASNLDLPAAAGSGTHQDHDEDLEAIYGTKIDDPSQLVYDIELMVDEIFDKCYQICAHHHDQRTTRKYTQSVTTLQNELIYETNPGDSHVSGRDLVMSFDVTTLAIKLIAMGAYHSLGTPTSEELTVEFYDSTRLSFRDLKVWSDERLDGCSANELSYMTNDAFMGALNKLSLKCANPDCDEDFLTESSNCAQGNHWDHDGGKENKPAELRPRPIVKLLNEIGRFCALTCASCHGVRTWLQKRFPNGGRLYREPELVE